jgi:hypothetical protein
MLFNKETEKIFCFWCNKWYDIHSVFLYVTDEYSITCEKNHLIGNEWDYEWQYFFRQDE